MFKLLFTQPVFNLLLLFYSLVGDFGVAIILLSIVVKLILWPMARDQYQQTKKIRDLQPEINQIKRQAKGNRQVESLMTMELYRKHEIKMGKTFLSTLIQLPILIAMFSVVRMMVGQNPVNFHEYTYDFLQSLEPVKNILANHEQMTPMLFGAVDLTKTAFSFDSLDSFIILIFVAGLSLIQWYMMSVQSKSNSGGRKLKDIFADAAAGKEADQSEITKLMMGRMNTFMPIMFFVSFGSLYGALSLYSFVNSVLSLVQQRSVYGRDYFKRPPKTTTIKSKSETEVKKSHPKAKTGSTELQDVKKRARKAQEAKIVEQDLVKQRKKRKKR